MKFAERPLLATLASAAVLLAATGCSVLEPDKIDYKSSGRGVSLVTDFNLKVEGDDALARR